jgi:hypothetical protein
MASRLDLSLRHIASYSAIYIYSAAKRVYVEM